MKTIKRRQLAYHKTQVLHRFQPRNDGEKAWYDAMVYMYEQHVVTHLQVYAKWNASDDGFPPNSHFDIFFCVQGQYDIPENSSEEQKKELALYETILNLYPLAYKRLQTIKDECGVGSISEHLLIDEKISRDDIDYLLKREDIHFKDLRQS